MCASSCNPDRARSWPRPRRRRDVDEELGAVVATGAAELEAADELDEDLGAAVGGAAVGTGVGAGAQAATASTIRTSRTNSVNARVRISSPP